MTEHDIFQHPRDRGLFFGDRPDVPPKPPKYIFWFELESHKLIYLMPNGDDVTFLRTTRRCYINRSGGYRDLEAYGRARGEVRKILWDNVPQDVRDFIRTHPYLLQRKEPPTMDQPITLPTTSGGPAGLPAQYNAMFARKSTMPISITFVSISETEAVYFVNAGPGVDTKPVLGRMQLQFQEVNGRKFLSQGGNVSERMYAYAEEAEITAAKTAIADAFLAGNTTRLQRLSEEQVDKGVLLLAMGG